MLITLVYFLYTFCFLMVIEFCFELFYCHGNGLSPLTSRCGTFIVSKGPLRCMNLFRLIDWVTLLPFDKYRPRALVISLRIPHTLMIEPTFSCHNVSRIHCNFTTFVHLPTLSIVGSVSSYNIVIS